MFKPGTFVVAIALCAACDSATIPEDSTPESIDHIAHAARRIDIPREQDTLKVGVPFRLKAAVDCHNPIIGIRVEITDGAKGQGDGDVLTHIAFPARGTNSFEMDTLLTLPSFSQKTGSGNYGFILVEVYEEREYRAGFEPVVILD